MSLADETIVWMQEIGAKLNEVNKAARVIADMAHYGRPPTPEQVARYSAAREAWLDSASKPKETT